jgi:hypothetical protein
VNPPEGDLFDSPLKTRPRSQKTSAANRNLVRLTARYPLPLLEQPEAGGHGTGASKAHIPRDMPPVSEEEHVP